MIKKSDIIARHPINIECETDADYALIANRIYDIMEEDLFTVFDDQKRKNDVCIDIALYFEDLKSGTHQFEVFTKLYKQMFGLYLPFHASESADSPTAELDAMAFILWHTLSAKHETILNPLNSDLRKSAGELLDFWHKEKDDMPANELLADYIYSEEAQNDPYNIRNILMWIESRTYLGSWFSNWKLNKESCKFISELKKATDREKQYALDCLASFANQSWPLSMPAKHIYAEMIRMEMDDPDDPMAQRIEEMEYQPFDMYHVTSIEKNGFYLKDYKEDKYFIKTPSEKIKIIKGKGFYLGGIFSFKGEWYLNGAGQWFEANAKSSDKIYLESYKKKRDIYNCTHDNGASYNMFLKGMSGKRLKFFKNINEYVKWGHDAMGISLEAIKADTQFMDNRIMAFLESNGQVTLSNSTWFVKHPDNPDYDKERVIDESLKLCDIDFIRPECVLYLIEHDLVPDCSFNDIKGEEHGRILFQENIEFVVRCIRRDIESTEVYRKRNKDLFLDEKRFDTETKEGKLTLEEFSKAIIFEKRFFGKTGKEWHKVSSNLSLTILKDVKQNKEHFLSTKKLYEAHLALSEKEINIKNLVPYVGQEDAPAACAVLYSIVGRGVIFNAFRNLSELLFNNQK